MSHVLQVGDVTIFHNGDYSGDVTICAYDPDDKRAFDKHRAAGRPFVIHPRANVSLPFEVLLSLVGNYVRDRKIAALEQADPRTLLLGDEP